MRLSKIAVGAAAAGLCTGLAAGAPAQAAPAVATPEAAAVIAERLGSAGAYRDLAIRKMVVTVTSNAQAKAVRQAGAVPKLVKYDFADLQLAMGTLNSQAKIPGTTWAIEPRTNRVEATYDSTVSRADLAKLTAVAKRFGDAVKITRDPGTLSQLDAGGRAIYGGGIRCSLGFNVRRGDTYYFLTAGHCTNASYHWSGLWGYLGYREHSWFPGRDHGIVRYNSNASRTGHVYLYNGSYQDIARAGNAYVGQRIHRSGSTTGLRSGYVTATNATVHYSAGPVYGMIRTNACAEGGDSGGAMFAGSTALGMTSGGSGNCSSGGMTFFEPVTRSLSYYGVNVY